jgi:hypothetical protein
MKKKFSILGAVLLTLSMAGAVLAADAAPGTMSVDVFVAGLKSSGTTEVQAGYYPAAGAANPVASFNRTITKYGGYEFKAGDSGLSSGWTGAMVVTAGDPVAALGEIMMTGGSAADGKRVGYYNGFSEPAETLYLPYAVYAKVGGTGDITQFSRFTIQNTDAGSTAVDITYIDRGGTKYGPYSDSIPGNGAKTYDLTDSSSPGVPDFTTTAYWTANGNWTGGVIIEAEAPVAAALLNTWKEYAGSYSALASGGETIYLTNIERKLYNATSASTGKWEGLTSIVVQNFDLVNPVNIKVTFYSKTTGGTKSFNDTLGAGAAKGYNTRTGGDTPGGKAFYEALGYWDDIPTAANTNLGNWTDGYTLWGGSAVIEGGSGANIAAAVFNVKMRQATSAMFTSVSDADAATTLVFPTGWRRRNTATDRWNLLRVMNVGTSAASDVDFYFYNLDGSLKMQMLNQTAPKFSIVDGMNMKGFTALGTTWQGTIVVTSDQPVVGTADLLWSADRYGAFNAHPLK